MATYKFKATDSHATRRFNDIDAAERYARARCAKAGERWRVESLMDGSNGLLIAEMRRDNAGRIWTDVSQHQNSFI